jgi:hypothetical protein
MGWVVFVAMMGNETVLHVSKYGLKFNEYKMGVGGSVVSDEVVGDVEKTGCETAWQNLKGWGLRVPNLDNGRRVCRFFKVNSGVDDRG